MNTFLIKPSEANEHSRGCILIHWIEYIHITDALCIRMVCEIHLSTYTDGTHSKFCQPTTTYITWASEFVATRYIQFCTYMFLYMYVYRLYTLYNVYVYNVGRNVLKLWWDFIYSCMYFIHYISKMQVAVCYSFCVDILLLTILWPLFLWSRGLQLNDFTKWIWLKAPSS